MIEIPGIKFAYMVAGFFGGIVSLRYIEGLTWWKGLSCVATGMAVANYITPVFQHFLKMPHDLEFGAAFLTGFIALSLMAGIWKKADKWKNNPELPGEQK